MPKSKYNNYTKEQLIDKILLLEKQRYGLVWEDKPEAIANQCEKELPVLTEDKTKEISNDPTKPTNFIFEGDNYHTLYTLNFTHKRKIDVIYIDPPYNSGSKDFKYNDKFIEKSDTYKHSMWLSFMYKRLIIAKRLLKNTGVIFISIDDNEMAQLKFLCNKIFLEQNFLGNLSWIKRTKSTNSGTAKFQIQQKIEYILAYAFNRDTFGGFNLLYSDKLKKYPHNGLLGKCRFENLEATDLGRKKRDTMKFAILGVNPRKGKRWQIGEIESKRLIREKKIQLVDGIPKLAVYPEDEESNSFIPFWSHLENVGTAEDAKKELTKIVGQEHNFDTVKPINLLSKILERCPNNSIILDFFAGSGTTGQAVLELNEQDGGNRQFILCTNNENKICEEVAYPRIKKVIEGYGTKKGIKANVKYFKTDYVPYVITDNDKRTLVARSTELLCIAENTFEVVKQNKKKLDYAIFKNAKQHTAIIYDEDSVENCCNELNKINPKHKVVIYVFSYDHTYDDVDFKTLTCKFDVKPIPEAILNVYRKIAKLKRK